jgi:hypothetical protein
MARPPASLGKVLRFSKPEHRDAGLKCGLMNGQPNADGGAPPLSVIGGKADMPRTCRHVPNDPLQTLRRAFLTQQEMPLSDV